MIYQGVITKMHSVPTAPVTYYLDFGGAVIHVNECAGKTIQMEFIRYQCLSCGADKKLFRGGYCYDCFHSLPQAADWVIHPELSRAHLGIEDRDLEYEREAQLQPHYVYLANTGKPKVGVTRHSQIPTRWIDQGAHEALIILETPNRYLAGIAEKALKEHISDKTNRNLMLTTRGTPGGLPGLKKQLLPYLPAEVKDYVTGDQTPYTITYPLPDPPSKIKALKIDEAGTFEGKLAGIKGQYWIFYHGTVWNVRSHEGFVLRIKC